MTFLRLLLGRNNPIRARLLAWLAVATLASMATVALVGSIIVEPPGPDGHPVDLERLALFVFIAAIMALGQYRALELTTTACDDATDRLRRSLAVLFRRAPPGAVRAIGTARVFDTMNRTTTVLAEAGPHVIYGLITAAIMILVLVYVCFVAPFAFLVMALLAAGTLHLYLRGRARTREAHAAARQAEERYLDKFLQLLEGHNDARLDPALADDLIDSHMSAALAESDRLRHREAIQANRALMLGYGGFYLILAAMIFALPQYLGTIEAELKVAVSTLFLFASLNVVMRAAPMLTRANVALKDIDRLRTHLADAAAVNVPGTGERGPLESLALIRVSRRALNGGRDIGPITLDLRPASITVVTGLNGAGKKSLLLQIAGIEPPDAGEMRWNDVAMTQGDLPAWRAQCASVFEDSHLFDRIYGLDNLEAEAIAETVRNLGLDAARCLDDRRIRAGSLSRAERQRLLMALALLRDRPVLLLEEPLAGQDSQYRAKLTREILPALRARNVCVVIATAGDESVIGIADRVVRIEAGKLVGGT